MPGLTSRTYNFRFLCWFILLLALTQPGCSVVLFNTSDPTGVTSQACQKPPDDPKSHVHVVFIHGIDPLDLGNLTKVVSCCKEDGYHALHVLTYHERREVIETITAIKCADPSARILIFGYSAGAATARYVVKGLHEHHGIDIEVVMYISGIMLRDTPFSRPDYVGKIIHILDSGRVIPGTELTGAENHRFTDVWHFGTPTHPQTLQILKRELDSLAQLH